ncbi:hypothetical protein QQS21_008164 [Conoideocrella luteorostrata]|uniref:NADH dehydrogenase [ubiquinone] 1 alpha subcomplex subunit n=1 Tax=Conoideocrella luteorostrata TaxID=1105319 RepID=A0AAJ0CM18_9HYPO|nr:hypothetical protein QQS21_008164 [Conoideocrella luteorostrata]
MSTRGISPLAHAWYRWKALRLPWRKRFFIGYDLQGNTYWEFRLTSNETRWRRIVSYPRSAHYSSVRVSPLWHQWLRHTRVEPPSLDEQRGDIARQERMKYLAQEADARWEAKPKVMEDAVARSAPALTGEATHTHDQDRRSQTPHAGQTEKMSSEKQRGGQKQKQNQQQQQKAEADDPWDKANGRGPSENWQPTTWNPTAKG